MAEFSYEALDKSQQSRTGKIHANSRREALQKLRLRKLNPIEVIESGLPAGSSDKQSVQSNKKTAHKLKIPFTLPFSRKKPQGKGNANLGLEFLHQLMELHESGMPVGDAIRILSKRTTNPELKHLCTELWNNLSSGVSLAKSLAQFPSMFSNSVVRILEAGEATGNIAPILKKIIDSLEETRQIRNKVFGSLAYPAFISMLAVAVVIFFLFYLLPQIRTMLSSLGGEMSLSAQILIQGSDLLIKGFPFIAIAGALLGSFLFSWIKTKSGRRAWDVFLVQIPVLGPIIHYSNLYYATHLLATLMSNKIHATESIRMVEKTITNTYLQERFAAARSQVIEGVSISKAFQLQDIFPSISLDILRIGEETGNTLHSLEKISASFRKQLTRRLEFATKLFSSLALFFAFALVALIAIGMVSSILQVSHSIQMQ